MEDYAKIVGGNIRDLRIRFGLSKCELARYIGVDSATIRNWENGKYYPISVYLPAIADRFCVSIDYLFGRDRATDRIMELQRENGILRQQIEKLHETKSELDAMRNELCFKCGNYKQAHNGACDKCRWKKEV